MPENELVGGCKGVDYLFTRRRKERKEANIKEYVPEIMTNALSMVDFKFFVKRRVR